MPSRLHSGFSPNAAWGSGKKAAARETVGEMFPLSSSEKHKKMTKIAGCPWAMRRGWAQGLGMRLLVLRGDMLCGTRCLWVRLAGIQPELDSF